MHGTFPTRALCAPSGAFPLIQLPSILLAAESDTFLDSNSCLVTKNLLRFLATSVSHAACVFDAPSTERRGCAHEKRLPLSQQTHEPGYTLGDVKHEGRKVAEVLPDLETQFAERNWFVVLDEEYFSCGGLRGQQVLSRKHMSVCHIFDIGDVPKIGAITDNPRRLLLGDAGVYRGDQLSVSFAKDD